MATIRPFAAVRPPAEEASDVSAVPYDVVSADEARQLAEGNPWSFLHVSRPEIDLPAGTDPYSDVVYRKAAENFEKLRRDCPLSREEIPSLYLYRLRMGGHEQTGIAACFSVDDYDSGIIRKHERTRKDKEDDRTRHMVTLSAQTGPVFLTYRDRLEIDRIVNEAKRPQPLYDFTAADGVTHTIWRLEPSAGSRLVEEFLQVPLIYIADGHHRVASAGRARDQRKQANPRHSGTEDYNFFLGVVFPARQLQILPYNRVVRDLNGRTPEAFLAALKEKFVVTENASPSPARKGEVSVYLDGRWLGVRLAGGGAMRPAASAHPASAPISALDASLLQDLVLDPLLGIKDVRTDKRIDFIGGIRGTSRLEELVSAGKAAAAFSMFPVTLDELMAVSDANEIMPPKSTWFEPKLRDGLLIHTI